MAADEFTCASGAGRFDPARGPLVPLPARNPPGTMLPGGVPPRAGNSASTHRAKTNLRSALAAWAATPASARRAHWVVGWRKAVARVITATRRDHDVSQGELARRIGWSRSTLAKAEAGERKTELGDVLLIAHALGEKPDRLLRRILAWNG